MTFERIDPDPFDGVSEQWGIVAREPVSIAVLRYAFRQYRIQVWIQRGHGYPWILSPEC